MRHRAHRRRDISTASACSRRRDTDSRGRPECRQKPPFIEGGELGGRVLRAVHQVGDQAEHLRHLLAFHGDPVLDDADGHGDAVAGQLREVRAVGEDLARSASAGCRFSAGSARACGPISRAIRAAPWIVAVHQPDPVRGEQVRELPIAVSRSFCSAAALSVPAGPCGIPSSARVEAVRQRQRPQLRERRRVIPGADGAVHGPVRGRVRHPDQRPVERPRLQRPVPADGRPPASPGPGAPATTARSTMSRSSSSGSGPSAFRQSPSARSDAGAHGRAHGTSARSPASAIIASRAPRVRHQRHQHDGPDHERPGQQPLPLALHVLVPAARARSAIAVDHARPGLLLQPSSSGPSVA